ncbi:DUF3488 and transglutaminase-like domain-containing protein [uncultured Pseudacidovorax sp.]|uniref:transglutaminase family protein n=1 Tax=uncultured Pseudacidovorax sp. TaxID=679313 RepID=UPI0025F6D931|nr:DUF3488 and transglutaminase-like domain-containing protein [uncultured Pseudacidovorax sp.]
MTALPLRLRTRAAGLPRDARDTLFLLAVIAVVLLPQLPTLPLWTSALAGAVLVGRGLLAWRSAPLPGWRWRVGMLLLALAATWLSYRTLIGREAGVTLVVVLLALKTLELRARRDAFVVFFLSFFVMLTSFFQSQSLLTAALMLLALMGLLTALVNAHMPVGRPPLAQSARIAAFMTLAGAPVMLALFLFFPRLAPLWGTPNEGMTGRSGLSATMRVGTIAQLALDDGIAARVRFDGDAPPPRTALYFRGPVLSRFDGVEWTSPEPWERGLPQLRSRGEPVGYEITLEPSNRPWLLALDAMRTAPALPDGLRALQGGDLQWSTNRPIGDLLRYRGQSQLDFTSGPVRRAGLPGFYLALPPGSNPRTAELARQLQAQAGGSTTALVDAVLQRLRAGGYVYTLEPGVYGAQTADEFWFDRKAGFCEHIASSFVILMRAAGVPARIVTGFQGGEINPVDGYWTLRNSDAHAWAEVWEEGKGWWRVDPTAAVSPGRVGQFQRLVPPPGFFAGAIGAMSPTLMQHARALWEAVNNAWNQRVLNYTQTRQLDLLKALGMDSPSPADLARVLLMALVAASLGGAAWAWRERRRTDPWLRLLARARARLARAGVSVPPDSPPRRMAELLATRFGEAAMPTRDWLLRLEAQRYARDPADDLAALRRDFRRLRWPG